MLWVYSLLLVPEQPRRLVGLEMLGMGRAMWGMLAAISWRDRQQVEPQ